MNTACNFTRGEEPGDGFAVSVDDACFGVDFEAAHGVVEDGGHVCDVEEVVHLEGAAGEELLAEGVLRGVLGDNVVVVDYEAAKSVTESER